MSIVSDVVTAVFMPKRKLGPIKAQVTIEETHSDELVITEHPVEQGAAISDHAYKRPAEVTLKCGWSNSGLQSVGQVLTAAYGLIADGSSGSGFNYVKDVYRKLLALQESRIPFTILTGKRQYKNMLIRSLSTTTDETSENCLNVTVSCREVILVRTRVTTVPPRDVHKEPAKTAPVEDKGTKRPATSGLYNLFGGK